MFKSVILGWTFLLLVRCHAYVPGNSYQPYPPAAAGYPPAYGGLSGAGYNTCGSLKVTEVLDQIYCHHGYYTRFTSTDLAAIKVVLYELGLSTKFAHIEAVLEYIEQAIYILQELKEETYKSYDTSALSKYYQGAGHDYTDLQAFLNNQTTGLQSFEDIRRGYRKQFGMLNWGTFVKDPYAEDYNSGTTKSRRNAAAWVSPLNAHSASGGRRATRASETEYDYAGDYTCALISASYCSPNSVVVKNVLYRVLKAVKSLEDGLTVLYDYIKNHNCGTNDDKKYALLVTADTFGGVLCATSVLLEAAKYEYNIYSGMPAAGANSYSVSTHARAGGNGGYSPAYQGYPYSYNYVLPSPYRYGRAIPVTPATTPNGMFFFG